MPTIWAIADLHLSFGTPGKSMDVFGPRWQNHAERVKGHWLERVNREDLVLIAGDISWAKLLSEAELDLAWIHQLPGTKVLLKGNHDYWWGSLSSLAKVLPPSMTLIQNNVYNWHGVSIGGSRLWDTPEFSFEGYVQSEPTPAGVKTAVESVDTQDSERIFVRELQRLELSLKAFDPNAKRRIAMTHYPPIGPSLDPSRASRILEKYRVDDCVFGHVHNVPPGRLPFGMRDGVRYHLTACDYLECSPLKIWDFT